MCAQLQQPVWAVAYPVMPSRETQSHKALTQALWHIWSCSPEVHSELDTDAVKVCRSYGGAGALWHIWPRDSREAMERFLRRHAAEIAAEGCSVNPDDILHPIHDQVGPLCKRCPLMHPNQSQGRSQHSTPVHIVD